MDAQLPPVLARWIAAKGHEAQHVSEIGMAGASDQAIWNMAVELRSVIVSKDEDFIQLNRVSGGPQIVWVACGNISKGALLETMKKAFPQMAEALEAGERIVEVR